LTALVDIISFIVDFLLKKEENQFNNMDNQVQNFTPLSNDLLNQPKKRSSGLVLILMIFSLVIIGSAVFLIVSKKTQKTQTVTSKVIPTPTEIQPTPLSTSEAELSPTSTATSPALIAENISPSPTVEPTLSPTPTIVAFAPSPTLAILPKTGELSTTPTPTEIILAKISATLTPATSSSTGAAAKTTEIPSVGVAKFGAIFVAIAISIILFGLVF
jgi:hypothetical protein